MFSQTPIGNIVAYIGPQKEYLTTESIGIERTVEIRQDVESQGGADYKSHESKIGPGFSYIHFDKE